jgi:hypothetical protein
MSVLFLSSQRIPSHAADIGNPSLCGSSILTNAVNERLRGDSASRVGLLSATSSPWRDQDPTSALDRKQPQWELLDLSHFIGSDGFGSCRAKETDEAISTGDEPGI